MMHSVTAQRFYRFAALLLALVCLWMNTEAELHHADDLSGLRTFAVGHARIGVPHALPLVPPCAACEWTQNLPTLHTPATFFNLAQFALLPRRDSLTPCLHLRAFSYTFLRAPPALLS